jgi:PAP2 superfamily
MHERPLPGVERRPAVRSSAARSAYRPSALREIALLVTLYSAYTVSRLLASGDRASAIARAGSISTRERAWHVAFEAGLNRAVTGHAAVEVGFAYWYSAAHYIVTPLTLLWLWRRRPDRYLLLRNTLGIATAVALVLYLSVPVAPPRMLAGYSDTLARTAWAGWWSAHASAPRGMGATTNELAAMPSMHVGWALWVALSVQSAGRHRARPLVWLYPLGTCVVVVGTGNHWTADAVVGALIVTGVHLALRTINHWRQESGGPPRRTAPWPAGCGRAVARSRLPGSSVGGLSATATATVVILSHGTEFKPPPKHGAISAYVRKRPRRE